MNNSEMLTRRELLTTFLGLPLAAAACRNADPRSFPHGEIVGQNVDLGHVLRQGARFDVPPDNWSKVAVGVVGGGIAGLTAAWQLKRSGIDDVVILELESQAGGTSRGGSGGIVPYPWGAHYLPVPFSENVELLALLDEMSITDGRRADGAPLIKEQYLCREPEERVFYKGRWYEGLYLNAGAGNSDKAQLQRFQTEIDSWIDWRDGRGRRAFAVPIATCSDDAETAALDKMSFAEWLDVRGYDSERLRWYCDYACRDDYGLKLDQTSAWAGLFYFCSRVRRSGVESQPFITFPEGNGRFVDHYQAVLSPAVRRSHGVVSIVPTDTSIDVTCLADGAVRGFRCKRVIYAAPVFAAPYVIRGFRDDAAFSASDFQHNAWFVANLFLSDRPQQRFSRDFPLAWDNVLYESPSLGYVTATHQKGIDHGPTVLTYYYPMCQEESGRTKLFEYGWRDLADVCLTDLARAHPDIYELCERIDVMRWGHAMISPRPGFVRGHSRERAQQPYRNIHFAHTDLSGIALFEEAFYHGSRAAKAVRTELEGAV